MFDVEAGESSASEESGGDSGADDGDYDYNDGFLCNDEEKKSTSDIEQDQISFERRRANSALDEVYHLRTRLYTEKRLLSEMTQKKRKWMLRAKKLKKMLDVK